MEMHDDLGTGLTAIRYLAGMLRVNAQEKTHERINKIDNSAKELIDAMNDIVWTIRSGNDVLEDVLRYIRKQTTEQLETAGIRYSFTLPPDTPPVILSNDQKRNLLLIAKEAIHNIIKHSNANEVCMAVEIHEQYLHFMISDNGKGFHRSNDNFGNGLKNMNKRADQINARFEVLQREGTTIVVQMPLPTLLGDAALRY